MTMKYQMTRHGMQSLYTLAWLHGTRPERQSHADPMFSGYGSEQVEEAPDADALALEATLSAPGRVAHLEAAVRGEAYARRQQDRRDAHLLWLGYSGM